MVRRPARTRLLLGAAAALGAAATWWQTHRNHASDVSSTLRRLPVPPHSAFVVHVPKREPEPEPIPEEPETTLSEQRRRLFLRMQRELGLSPAQFARVREIIEHSPLLGQGNPDLTRHPMTRQQCREIRATAPHLARPDPECGSPNMVSISQRSDGTAQPDAGATRVCIDQYEFPNIACEYPIVHVSAREALLLCEAVGKRLCDAHEWEGACAGNVLPADEEYLWDRPRALSEYLHNRSRAIVWAYGPEKNHALCATGSIKTSGCPGGGYWNCGSNTYPAGAFPACVSAFGVYDQHGNVAEHMNLPTNPRELTSRGGRGYTEMKGSWFIFRAYEAHPDDCRWRAPDWHATGISDPNSHSNYHLGFRCCRSR